MSNFSLLMGLNKKRTILFKTRVLFSFKNEKNVFTNSVKDIENYFISTTVNLSASV